MKCLGFLFRQPTHKERPQQPDNGKTADPCVSLNRPGECVSTARPANSGRGIHYLHRNGTLRGYVMGAGVGPWSRSEQDSHDLLTRDYPDALLPTIDDRMSCLSVRLSNGLLPLHMSVYPSICLSINLTVYLSFSWLNASLSVCLSVWIFACLSLCLSVCLFVCLSV